MKRVAQNSISGPGPHTPICPQNHSLAHCGLLPPCSYWQIFTVTLVCFPHSKSERKLPFHLFIDHEKKCQACLSWLWPFWFKLWRLSILHIWQTSIPNVSTLPFSQSSKVSLFLVRPTSARLRIHKNGILIPQQHIQILKYIILQHGVQHNM